MNLAPADLRKAGPGFRPRDRLGDPRRFRAAPARHARSRAPQAARPRRRPAAGGRRPADGRGGGSARPDAARDRRAERPRGRARRPARPRRRAATTGDAAASAPPALADRVTGPSPPLQTRSLPALGRRSRRSRTWPSCAASRNCAARSRSRRAGGHGLLMIGPPGAGKSLAARRLPSLLPPLTIAEALEVRRDRERLRRRSRFRRGQPPPAVPAGTPPHDLPRRPRRWRLAAATGRGDARAPRGAVSR